METEVYRQYTDRKSVSYCCLSSVVLDDMEHKYTRKRKKYMKKIGKKGGQIVFRLKPSYLKSLFPTTWMLRAGNKCDTSLYQDSLFYKLGNMQTDEMISQGLHLWV